MSSVTEQIKERVDIADFIGQYIELKPSGANLKALCPFHHEQTPSFMVSSAKQIFKCFGCGKGGDIFNFVKEYEGMEFAEALQLLAHKAGIELPLFNKESVSEKNRLYDLLKSAADFYHHYLLTSSYGDEARRYLQNRHIDDVTCDQFKLGLSPFNASLYNFLKKRRFIDEEMLSSGLFAKADKGYYDRFRGRLMFPIFDMYSRVVGFGGRILKEDKNYAKYINTPSTELYDKSRVLYGLDKAKDSIRKNGAVIVEGYMDVIASHKAAVPNVVAASGIALTHNQLGLLNRFTNLVYLAFDMDEAGIQAALRSYQVALSLGINVKVVSMPAGIKDPDELISQNTELWRHAIKKSQHIIDYYFDICLKGADLKNLYHKKIIRDKLMPFISSIPDPVERNHFLGRLASLLDVVIDDLALQCRSYQNTGRNSFLKEQKSLQNSNIFKSKKGMKSIVEHLLALILMYPKQVLIKELPNLVIGDDKLNNLYKEVKDAYNNQTFDEKIIAEWRSASTDKAATAEELLLLGSKDYNCLLPHEIEHEGDRLLSYIHTNFLIAKRRLLMRKIQAAENIGDESKVIFFSNELDKLNVLKKIVSK